MKLDRNILRNNGRGKYALLKLRDLKAYEPTDTFGTNAVMEAILTLQNEGLIEWGAPNTEGEFFVIKLRDLYAAAAMDAYCESVRYDTHKGGDREYADEVRVLADRAGSRSPFCKRPD